MKGDTGAQGPAGASGSSDGTTRTVAMADPSQANGTTDNTAYLQSFIASATAAGKLARIPAATWVVTELQVPSGAIVDATGATFISGATRKRLLINTSLAQATPGTSRDANITWVGGTFDKGNADLDTINTLDSCTVQFGFVDGLTIRGMRLRSTGANTGGKYALYLWNVNRFRVEDIDFAVVSDGVHASGSCIGGLIRNIGGSTGDDSVAIMPSAGPDTLDLVNGFGETSGIVVEGVYTTSYRCGVKVLGGKNQSLTVVPVRNILVRAVDGTFGTSGGTSVAGVYVGGDVSGGSYPKLQGGYVDGVRVEGVVQRNTAIPAACLRGLAVHYGTKFASVRNVGGTSTSVAIQSCSSGSSLEVCDCEYTLTGAAFVITHAGTGAAMRQLVLRNLKITGPASGTALVGLVNLGSSSSVPSLVVDSVRSSGAVYAIGQLGNACSVFARGLWADATAALGWMNVLSTAVVTIKEASFQQGSSEDFTLAAGGLVKSEVFGFKADASKLAKVANAMAYNTNAALSCGVGPIVCDGTSWKHLFTGATY